MQRWRWDFISSAGYDDNLGRTAPRRAIRPEVGSVYHTLFESLEGFIDLPERINLGDKPVGGIWLGLHPGRCVIVSVTKVSIRFASALICAPRIARL